MEDLVLHDTAPPAGGGQNAQAQPMAQQTPQLPPQMFTTAAQLLDLTDTNLVLQDTVERIFAQEVFADVPRGVFLVRGENVLLLGEIDLDKDDDIPEPFERASPERVYALQKEEQARQRRRDKTRQSRLQALGFDMENSGEVLL
ncbi:MAG: SM-like, degradation of cytoplasmic mRNAs and positively regulates transcription initiation [Thelocarpon impressellum]|nr:MAG: SM-like, degradation of cytoplasmic mRNAs and positively regulates transcription initiation [Thelocarpon impressellum]